MTAGVTEHPLAQRFLHVATGLMALEAVALQQRPVVVVAAAIAFLTAVIPRATAPLDRILGRSQVGKPAEPARITRGAVGLVLGVGAGLLYAGQPIAGWIVVGAVATAALLAAVSGFCIGCSVYALVLRLLKSRDGQRNVRADLGLEGDGPWVVLVTAPGCNRCDPVARALESMAERDVTVVDLARHPRAVRAGVNAIPAALAVSADGTLQVARSGWLDAEELRAVADAV